MDEANSRAPPRRCRVGKVSISPLANASSSASVGLYVAVVESDGESARSEERIVGSVPLLESGLGDSVAESKSEMAASVGGALTGSGDDESTSWPSIFISSPSWSGRQLLRDASSISGHEELCVRGGRSGGGLLEGVGMLEV